MTKNYKSLFKSSIVLMFVTVFVKLLGLIREIVMASYLGTSSTSDAYVLGTTISSIIIAGFASYFLKAYIPVATEEKIKSEQKLNDYTGSISALFTLFALLVSMIIFFTSSVTISLLGSGTSDDTKKMAIIVSEITAFPTALLITIYIFQGYLNIKGKFLPNMVYPFLMNIILIVFIIIWKGNVYWLSIGYDVSIVLSLLILFFLLKKNGYKKAKYSFKEKSISKTIFLTIPLIFGGLVSEINEIVDRGFAANYETGVVSALRYGKLLEIFIVSAIALSIGQVLFPKISECVKTDNKNELDRIASKTVSILFIVCLPITVFAILKSNSIVEFVFARGEFDATSVENTGISFMMYCFSILPVSFSEILSRIYFAYNDGKRPVIFSMTAMGLNIVLNALVVFVFDLPFYWLAITTSICETLLFLMFLIGLIVMKRVSFKLDMINIAVSTMASASLGVLIYYLDLGINNIYISLITIFVIFLVLYISVFILCNYKKVMQLLRRRRKEE